MLICIFLARTLAPMSQDIVPGKAGIGEEQVAESAPMVRALVVQRLELLWRTCEPHINLSQDDLDLGRRPDVRFVEAGIRVVDRLTSIYGLLRPQHQMSEPETSSRLDQRQLALQRIQEIEEKLGSLDM